MSRDRPAFGQITLHTYNNRIINYVNINTLSIGVFPVFPCHKFHSTISPHSSHSFSFISSSPVMLCQACRPTSFTVHKPSIKGLHRISSLDLALCQPQVEVKKPQIPRNYKFCLMLLVVVQLYISRIQLQNCDQLQAGSISKIRYSKWLVQS